jgi:hypothetical protein
MTFVGDTDPISDFLCVRVGYAVASMRNNSDYMPVVSVECVVAGKNGRNKCN